MHSLNSAIPNSWTNTHVLIGHLPAVFQRAAPSAGRQWTVDRKEDQDVRTGGEGRVRIYGLSFFVFVEI